MFLPPHGETPPTSDVAIKGRHNGNLELCYGCGKDPGFLLKDGKGASDCKNMLNRCVLLAGSDCFVA